MELKAGQRFVDGDEAIKVVRAYALGERKTLRNKPCGGNRKHVVCSSAAAGCPYYVKLRRTKAKNQTYWYISKLCLEHTNCTSTAKPSHAQLVRTQALMNAVTANPTIKASSAGLILQMETGLSVPSRSTFYRALASLRGNLRGDLILGHQRLPSFLEQFRLKNPGSVIGHDYDGNTRRFQRACLIPGQLATAASRCQRILGLDGGHMKTDDFDGLQLLLVGRDGNYKNVTIAAALIRSESKEDFVWFLTKLGNAGVNLNVPIFCDRAPGLAAAGKALALKLINCAVHIYRNTLLVSGFNKSHKDLFYQLQSAETKEMYESTLAIIAITAGNRAATYLKNIDPTTWALHPHLHTVALYGWRSTNFIESEMAATKETGLRSKPPFNYFEAVMLEMMADCVEHVALIAKWTTKGQVITDGAMKQFMLQKNVIGDYRCDSSNAYLHFVFKLGLGPPHRRRVNLMEKSCTCGYYTQHRIPCRHMCAALHATGTLGDVWSYFASEYKVATYAAAFQDVSLDMPVHDELDLDDKIVPSMKVSAKKKRGPKPSKRIPSTGESFT